MARQSQSAPSSAALPSRSVSVCRWRVSRSRHPPTPPSRLGPSQYVDGTSVAVGTLQRPPPVSVRLSMQMARQSQSAPSSAAIPSRSVSVCRWRISRSRHPPTPPSRLCPSQYVDGASVAVGTLQRRPPVSVRLSMQMARQSQSAPCSAALPSRSVSICRWRVSRSRKPPTPPSRLGPSQYVDGALVAVGTLQRRPPVSVRLSM